MRKLNIFTPIKPKSTYYLKPYEQMIYPGQRVHADMKVIFLKYIADPELRLFHTLPLMNFRVYAS